MGLVPLALRSCSCVVLPRFFLPFFLMPSGCGLCASGGFSDGGCGRDFGTTMRPAAGPGADRLAAACAVRSTHDFHLYACSLCTCTCTCVCACTCACACAAGAGARWNASSIIPACVHAWLSVVRCLMVHCFFLLSGSAFVHYRRYTMYYALCIGVRVYFCAQ